MYHITMYWKSTSVALTFKIPYAIFCPFSVFISGIISLIIFLELKEMFKEVALKNDSNSFLDSLC